MNDDRMLTLAQAAAVAGVDPSRLRQLIAADRLKAIKPGHDWLIMESELRRWMETDRDRRYKASKPAGDGDGGDDGQGVAHD